MGGSRISLQMTTTTTAAPSNTRMSCSVCGIVIRTGAARRDSAAVSASEPLNTSRAIATEAFRDGMREARRS